MTRFIFVFLSALLSSSPSAWAFQNLQQAPKEGTAEIPSERWQAAEELLEVTEMAEMMQRVTDQQLREQLADTPEMAPFKDVIQEFFHKYLTWEAFREPFTRIYAETFTTDELRELSAFYRTPTGQRIVQVQAEIVEKSSRLGKQVIEEHQGELIEAIQKRASEMAEAELNQAHGQPSPQSAHEHGSPPQGGRIILVLPDAQVEAISSQQLTALDRQGQSQMLDLTEDSSFQDESGFPVEDQLQDEQGQWDGEKLREFLPAGSKIQVQYFVRGERKLIHLVEKSN